MARIAIISDTHGLLRPEVVDSLQGCEHILHAGDVGKPHVLESLREIAPVTAVRGNVDFGELGSKLYLTDTFSWRGKTFYLVHIREELDLDPVKAEIDCVVFGHTHQPERSEQDGVLYLNPGSCGPRRFSLPIAWCTATLSDAGELVIEDHRLD